MQTSVMSEVFVRLIVHVRAFTVAVAVAVTLSPLILPVTVTILVVVTSMLPPTEKVTESPLASVALPPLANSNAACMVALSSTSSAMVIASETAPVLVTSNS